MFILLPTDPVSLLGTESIHFEDSHKEEGSAWPWESGFLKLGS